MEFRYFLIILVFLGSIHGQIISDYSCVLADDYYFQWRTFDAVPKTATSWPYLSMVARTNALNGYTFVAISPQLNNFTNGLVFATFYDAKLDPNGDGSPAVWWYEPGPTSGPETPTAGLTWINQTAIPREKRLLWKTTWKTLSITRPNLLYNEFTSGVLLNLTLTPAFFNRVANNVTDWYVYMAVNYNTKPPLAAMKDPQRLPPLGNEKILHIFDWRKWSDCFVPGIYRWSLLTIPTYVIELAFYFLLTPLCLILSWKWEPMKSRGFTPALAAFSQFVVLLSQVHYLAASVELISQHDCLFQIFLYYSATQVSLILLPIHLLRYIFIINLNRSKDIFYAKIQVTKEGEQKRVEVARWPFRMIKVLTNQWLNAGIVVMWYLFSVSVQVIVYLASGFNCSRAAYPLATLQTITIVFFIIVWLGGLAYDFIAAMIDVIRLMKQEKAHGITEGTKPNLCKSLVAFYWEQFAKKDPFYYRFELYFIGPGIIIFYVVVSLCILIAKVDTQRGVSIFISTTLFILLLFYQILFPLVMTIITIIRQCFNPNATKMNEEIDVILFDAKGHELFVEFAKSEWSTENISCFDDIYRYKKEKDPQRRLEIAEEIYLTYFNGSKSKLEVNVNRQICDEVKNKLNEAKNEEMFINKPLEDEMFDNAEGAVKVNLCDTFSRLRLTQVYRNYHQNLRFTRDALGIQ